MRSTARKIRPRHGTTLIEVLAGLVVLATLLAAVGVARGRFLRQWSDADAKLRGARAADALLAAWVSDDAVNVPPNANGSLDGWPQGAWRTHVVPDAGAAQLGTVVVRLDVFRRDAAAGRPVFSVDLLTPAPRPRKTP